MADGRHFEKSLNRHEILYEGHITLLSPTPGKFRIFENPRWRTAAVLESVKSPYLGNGSTDLHGKVMHYVRLYPIDRKKF